MWIKISSKKLNRKIFNYDIDKNLTEIHRWEIYKYDIVVFNHVIMYMTKSEFIQIIKKIKKKIKSVLLLLV